MVVFAVFAVFSVVFVVVFVACWVTLVCSLNFNPSYSTVRSHVVSLIFCAARVSVRRPLRVFLKIVVKTIVTQEDIALVDIVAEHSVL